MNTITVRILVFFLSLFIMITVFSQISMQFKDDYVTETAVIYSSVEKVAFQGVYVRNETVISSRANGVISYTCRDGSKVANGSVVAYTYQSENDILVNQQIKKLKEEVELLESAQNPGTTAVVEPAFISEQIDEQYQTIAFLIAENDLESLDEERKKLQTLMDIYQIVINEETDFNSEIDKIPKFRNLKKVSGNHWELSQQKMPAILSVILTGLRASFLRIQSTVLLPRK